MHSLCFVAFQLLHHDRLVGQMQPSIGSLPKFEERALDGFLHLLRLSTGAPEDDDPSIFTQLLAQRLGVLLQLLEMIVEPSLRTWTIALAGNQERPAKVACGRTEPADSSRPATE
ncbi:hypothetical protein HG530_004892 [Fusarium avenaceum]|nr:hypothetical protein HG530_004892 [Fusarium avenaceum]